MTDPMKHERLRGRIRYTSKKPEMLDKVRGDEIFNITRHSDGAVTVRAHCEIHEPAPTVLRDIVYSMDKNLNPLDCHVRLVVGDEFMGSGWFRFDLDEDRNGVIECESYGPSIGRMSQTMPTRGPFDGFGTHPIIGDALMCKVIDRAGGPTRRNIRVFLPSPDHRGATPPMVSEVSIGLEYVGDETQTVEAGTFDCHHFRYVDDSGPGMGGKQHPTYDMWVTKDDFLFVKGGVGGYMATWYELVELERR
ncbi:MAG: hypothetical protein AAGA09_03790 [Pseudomonadota bacterium]